MQTLKLISYIKLENYKELTSRLGIGEMISDGSMHHQDFTLQNSVTTIKLKENFRDTNFDGASLYGSWNALLRQGYSSGVSLGTKSQHGIIFRKGTNMGQVGLCCAKMKKKQLTIFL